MKYPVIHLNRIKRISRMRGKAKSCSHSYTLLRCGSGDL